MIFVKWVGTKVPCLFCDQIVDHCVLLPSECLFGRLLGKQNSVDVGKNTTTGNCNSSKQLVQLFIVLDGKSDVARDNTALLVVTGGVSGEFKNFGAEVLQDSGEVDRGSGSHTGGVLSSSQVTADTTNGELQTCLGRCGSGLLGSTASFSFSCCHGKSRWLAISFLRR